MKSGWVFLLIPLIFLGTAFYYIQNAGPYFAATVDPEYNYLFNSITLAHLKFHLNAVGHPGTTVQILIALTAHIVHLFRNEGTLWDDVILNPEVYIEATVYTANIINAIFLFFLGRKVYQYSKNLVFAVILQLSPFAFLMIIEVSYRMMPELIMPSIVSCWIILLIKLLYQPMDERDFRKYSLLFGLLCSFSLATKLTYLPYCLLPLFLIPGIKLKLRYILISLLSFIVFAFPAILNYHKFFDWIFAIFIHKGPYGSGARGIIDVEVFTGNLWLLLKNTRQLWVPLILALVLTFFLRRRGKYNMAVKITVGMSVVVVLHYLITSKHYAFYYFIPSLLFAVFCIFLLVYHIKSLLPTSGIKRYLPEALFVLFAMLLIFNIQSKISGQFKGLPERKRVQRDMVNTFESYLNDNENRIICASYYGCSAAEYGLLFGLLESGRYGKELTAKYHKHYPSSYIYLHWHDVFYNGIYPIKPENILKTDLDYILYVADYSDDLFKVLLDKLQPDSAVYKQDVRQLFKSPNTFEAVYSFKLIKK